MSKSLQHVTSINNHSPIRRIINTWWEQIFRLGGDISPFERWTDENYAPRSLAVTLFDTQDTFLVKAVLPGFEAPDVHVDVCHGHLIILAARPIGRVIDEYYAEIPLPKTVQKRPAVMEFGDAVLTVSFAHTRSGVTYWLRTCGQALQRGIQHSSKAFGLGEGS